MGQIPRETIEQILDNTDIVELIGSHVQLKRAGTNHKGLCPFHIENSPSFNVNPHTQRYKCFGCGVGGDAIEFIKEYENVSFGDAVRKLADRAGVTIMEEVFDAKEEARRRSRGRVLRLQIEAAKFFHLLLFKGREAQPAREYLKSRGLNMEISRRWQFGYAPENQRIFFDWAQANDFPVPLLVEGGLAAWRDEHNPNRGAYARFRHRLMFPVANDHGDTIAFSGRVLSKDQKGGKYVNSPETAVFDKSKTFYGFDKTKRPVLREKKAIVCEGQLDLIAAFEAGIENVVAPLGTAFTEQHARLLKRHTDEVVLCFDSDSAGIAAATKAFRVLAPTGILVRIALLPPGEDPDSLIRQHGPASLEEIIGEAPEFFDFQIDRRGSLLTTGPLRDRLAFAKDLAFDVALIEDKMVQDSLINRISVRLKVGEDDIRRQVSGAKRDQVRAQRSKARRENIESRRRDERAGSGENGSTDRNAHHGASLPPTISNKSIRFFCQLLLMSPEVKRRYHPEPIPDFFRNLPETEMLSLLWSGNFDPGSPANVASFSATLGEPEQACISSLLDDPLPPEPEKLAGQCLHKLHRQSLRKQIDEIQARLADPELTKEQVESLQKEKIDLAKQLHDIPLHFSD